MNPNPPVIKIREGDGEFTLRYGLKEEEIVEEFSLALAANWKIDQRSRPLIPLNNKKLCRVADSTLAGICLNGDGRKYQTYSGDPRLVFQGIAAKSLPLQCLERFAKSRVGTRVREPSHADDSAGYDIGNGSTSLCVLGISQNLNC
jgi:hypothetical protein